MTSDGPWDEASAPLAISLAVRFALELALLLGTAVLFWTLSSGGWRWPAAVLAVVAVAVVWGLFLSPKAAIRLPAAAAFLIEALLFFGVGYGLFVLGYSTIASIGVIAWLADRIAIRLFRRRAVS